LKITWVQPYYDLILDKVPLDTESLIDVGSGYGIFGYILSKSRNIKNLISIEPFDYPVELYNTNHKMTWQKFYKSKLNLDKVDVIICTEMIEHLSKKDALLFLQQTKRKAKKVIIVTPYSFENQDAYDNNEYQKHQCVLSVNDFITEGYKVELLGVFKVKGLIARLYFHYKWARILRFFGINPTNIIGVFK